jgi:hypothetical protein
MRQHNQKRLSKKERGLGKYDAPLSIQYKKGMSAFRRNESSPYSTTTMQYREWLRGFNVAYVINLKKVKQYEARRRSKAIH